MPIASQSPYPQLRIVRSCTVRQASLASGACPLITPSASRRSVRLTQHPITRHCGIRRGPAHLGDRLRPLPEADRSNFSSDKQPSLPRSGPNGIICCAQQPVRSWEMRTWVSVWRRTSETPSTRSPPTGHTVAKIKIQNYAASATRGFESLLKSSGCPS